MIVGRREFVIFFVLTLWASIGKKGCRGQTSEDSPIDDNGDEAHPVPTFRSGIEKILQGLSSVVSGGSSSGRSSDTGGPIGRIIGSIVPEPVQRVVAPIENQTAKTFGQLLDLFQDNFHAIFPGTLWCGAGNIAKNEEDVGVFEKTDACCRAHDNCPMNIEAGKTYGRLLNNGAFTRSACSCDRDFYDCLKNADSPVSFNIGMTYFNILRPQCFSEEYPSESCQKRGSNRILNRKCVKYNVDTSRDKRLEWLDNPDF